MQIRPHGLNLYAVASLFSRITSDEFRAQIVNIHAFLTQNATFIDEFHELCPMIPQFEAEMREKMYYALLLILQANVSNTRLISEAETLIYKQFDQDSTCADFLNIVSWLLSGNLDLAEKISKTLNLQQMIGDRLLCSRANVQFALLRMASHLEFQQLIPMGYYIENVLEAFRTGDELLRVDALSYAVMCTADAHTRQLVLEKLALLNSALAVKNASLWGAHLLLLEGIVANSQRSVSSAFGQVNGPEAAHLQQQLSILDEMQIIEDALEFKDAVVQFRALYTLKRIAAVFPELLLEKQIIIERTYMLTYSTSPGVWSQAYYALAVICADYKIMYGLDFLASKREVQNPYLLSSLTTFLESQLQINPQLAQDMLENYPEIVENLRNATSYRNIYNFLFKYSLLNFEEDDLLVF